MNISKETLFRSITLVEDTKCGRLYITMDFHSDNSLHRIAATLGKSGTCAAAHLNTISALLTGIIQKVQPIDVTIITGRATGHKCGGNSSDQACCTDKLIRRVVYELAKENTNVSE